MEPNNQSFPNPNTSWFERNGFPVWLTGLGWVVISFILFQVIGSFLSILFIAIKIGHMPGLSNINEVLKQHLNMVFLGNSTGQLLFLGIGTWIICKLAAPGGNVASFTGFRVTGNIGRLLFLAFLIFITIQPVVWFLGWINSLIPLPSGYMKFERLQDAMLEGFLNGNKAVWLTLINVALVPAIFEEFMYRGFLLNLFKRAWGPIVAIVFSGILFGLYHVKLTQIIPLSFLGMILGFLAWKSESIYPAMIGHFVNNGLSIVLAAFMPNFVFSDTAADSMPPLIWVGLSVLVSGYLIYLFVMESQQNAKGVSHV